MVRDGELMLADQQALAGNAVGTFLSEQSIDVGTVDTMVAAFQARGAVRHDVGQGKTVYLNVQMVEDADSTNDTATLKFELVTADDDALTSNLVSVAIGGTALGVTALTAGTKMSFPVVLPPGLGADQFFGLRMTVGTQEFTAGKFDAWLSSQPVPRWP